MEHVRKWYAVPCSVTSVLSDSLLLHGCSPSGSSVPGILQERILEWVTMPSSRGSSWPRDQTRGLLWLLHFRQILYCWVKNGFNVIEQVLFKWIWSWNAKTIMSWSILWKTLPYTTSGESESINTIHMFCGFPYFWNLYHGHLICPPHAFVYSWEMTRE